MNRLLLHAGIIVIATGWQILLSETVPAAALTGFAVIVTGLLGAGAAVRLWPMRLGAVAALLALSALGAQTAAWAMAVWKVIPGLAPLIAHSLDVLGLQAAASDGHVVVHVSNQVLDFFPGTARLGGFVALVVMACAIGVIIALPVERPLRTLAGWLGIILSYAVVRLLVIAAARPELPLQGVETSPCWTLITWLPLALFGPRLALPAMAIDRPGSVESWGRAMAAFALGMLWIAALSFEDPGLPKAGRVLFDDAHGIWEPTTLSFDTADFSRRTAYSYSDFYDLLGRHFQIKRWQGGALTSAVLDQTDVLVIKTPTQPLAIAEIDLIERWVARGGGLYLIGDHTDLFGMSTYMNALARRFGLAFRSDDTYDATTGSTSTWQRSSWLNHPITAQVPSFEFETTCTLEVPPGARVPVLGYALGTDAADYNNPGFFGNIKLDPKDDYGFFPQLATVHFGRGRVAAFADSTPFSNFSLFFAGRPEMALSTVAFLNRTSTAWRYVPAIAAAAALFCLFVLLTTRAPGRRWDAAVVAFAVIVGSATASVMVNRIAARNTIPAAHVLAKTVAIDRSLSGGHYPPGLLTNPDLDLDGFDSFVLAVQRLKYEPTFAADLTEAVATSTAIILIHPTRAPTRAEQDALVRFVSRGGGLLVVDGIYQPGPATNDVLRPFGLAVGRQTVPTEVQMVVPEEDAPKLRLLRPIASVQGGFPVLTDADGRPIYAEADVGSGRVGVLVESAGISRAAFGNRFYTEPGDDQRQSYNASFLILRRIVEREHKP
jgi:uncharacterized membrane protein